MARFILDYDTEVSRKTKMFMIDNITPSMMSPAGDSAQYCLVDLIDVLTSCDQSDMFDVSKEDMNTLNQLNSEGVDYVEICF